MLSNSSSPSSNLSYLLANSDSFAGNFTAHKRFSFFDYRDYGNATVPVPCGFLKKFPVRDSGITNFGWDFFISYVRLF